MPVSHAAISKDELMFSYREIVLIVANLLITVKPRESTGAIFLTVFEMTVESFAAFMLYGTFTVILVVSKLSLVEVLRRKLATAIPVEHVNLDVSFLDSSVGKNEPALAVCSAINEASLNDEGVLVDCFKSDLDTAPMWFSVQCLPNIILSVAEFDFRYGLGLSYWPLIHRSLLNLAVECSVSSHWNLNSKLI